jgi:hypothetical protein
MFEIFKLIQVAPYFYLVSELGYHTSKMMRLLSRKARENIVKPRDRIKRWRILKGDKVYMFFHSRR